MFKTFDSIQTHLDGIYAQHQIDIGLKHIDHYRGISISSPHYSQEKIERRKRFSINSILHSRLLCTHLALEMIFT